jgi:RNA polymerase primary sigma factor
MNNIEIIIEEIKKQFPYLNLDDDNIKDIIINVVSNNLTADNATLILKISKRISLYIIKQIKEKKDYSYIYAFFDNGLNFDDIANSCKKIIRFFRSLDFIPDIDILIDFIMNNSKIKEFASLLDQRKTNSSSSLIRDLIDAYQIVNEDISNYVFSDIETFVSSDSLQMYMQEINLPLLTAEEEKALLIKYKHGDMQARNTLVERNLKFVVKCAHDYSYKYNYPILDLIEEGNLGLIKAVEKFDISKGYRLCTYAYHWIRCYISKFISRQKYAFNIPISMQTRAIKYNETVKCLESKLKRQPTPEEIAKEMNLSVDQITEIYSIIENQMITTSLNKPFSEDNDGEASDFVSDKKSSEFADSIINDMLLDVLRNVIASDVLNDSEKQVLKYRFGYEYPKILTLEDTGSLMGLTRERVRQIETKLIKKLSSNKQIRSIANYDDNEEANLKYAKDRSIYR